MRLHLAATVCLALLAAPSTGALRVRPGPRGHLGAWLAAGPFANGAQRAKLEPPSGARETDPFEPLKPLGSKTAAWHIAFDPSGTLHLGDEPKHHVTHAVTYLAGTLHVTRPGRYHFLLGVDDGVRMALDGKWIHTRDESRPFRAVDDIVAVDLAHGDHPLAFELHQRRGDWVFEARFLDGAFQPADDAWLELAGTGDADAPKMAADLVEVHLAKSLTERGYEMALDLRANGGRVEGAAVAIHATLSTQGDSVFDLVAGSLPSSGEATVMLPLLAGERLERFEKGPGALVVRVGAREKTFPLAPNRTTREAVAHASRASAKANGTIEDAVIGPTLELWRARVAKCFTHPSDRESCQRDAAQLEAMASAVEGDRDPIASLGNPKRLAYRSTIDQKPSEFALYVPPDYEKSGEKKYPLIVALHGLNGRPMSMLQWVFGHDDGGHDAEWEDRHIANLGPLGAFVLAPDGAGNTMYRDAGEVDVADVVSLVRSRFRLDPQRVTITGPSMGGTGAAHMAFRFPGVYAGAAPLCGYHSYFLRNDMNRHPIRPWERVLAEERSTVTWAENGWAIPLFVVHGKRDLPEENSGVLIKRYKALGQTVKHEHPDLAHNVWDETYTKLKGVDWLLSRRKGGLPTQVRFKTLHARYDSGTWAHVTALEAPDQWASIDATLERRAKRVRVRTNGTSGLAIDCAKLGIARVKIDNDDITLAATNGAPPPGRCAFSKSSGHWTMARVAEPVAGQPTKNGNLTGPLRDFWRTPLLFVYGVSDPAQRLANAEVAGAWSHPRAGIRLDPEVITDEAFFRRNEPLANDRSLVLIGNAASNRVVSALDDQLPLRISGTAISAGTTRFEGGDLGAAFIVPNPKRGDRYVVVIAGTTAIGTWRSLSLPELLPDFVVYDEGVKLARGQQVLGNASVRAAGFFDMNWTLPVPLPPP
jgi:poly(3-hydroxybutyrate) depolymerase